MAPEPKKHNEVRKYAPVEVKLNIKDPRKHRDEVRDSLNEFKKRMKKSGIMQELRKREHYVPPSKAARLKREESRKQRKRDEKKAQQSKKESF
jgi:small subunit ribosomal protein S21